MNFSFVGGSFVVSIIATILILNEGHPCGQPGSFANLGFQEVTREGHSASYRCKNRGLLIGKSRRVCQPNGVWEGTIPSCIHHSQDLGVYKCSTPILADSLEIRPLGTFSPAYVMLSEVYIYENRSDHSCPTPDVPAFGLIEGNNGRVRHYNCLDNYVLKGNRRTVCFRNGTWSKPAPVCQKKSVCVPFEGRVEVNGKWSIEEVEDGVWRGTFKCHDGFRLEGSPSTVECRRDRPSWDDTTATCRRTSELIGEKSSFIYSTIAFGCLFVVLVVIIVLRKWHKRRNLETVPYYAWSNESNGFSNTEGTQLDQVMAPRHSLVPCPLPRNAFTFQGHSQSPDTLYYSVTEQDNDYMTILENPPESNSTGTSNAPSRNLEYRARSTGSLYADGTAIPQPPNTRFSELMKKSEELFSL